MIQGRKEEALLIAQDQLQAVRSEKPSVLSDRFALSRAYKLVGDILWRTGDKTGAKAAWRAGIAAWPNGITANPRQLAERGEMLRGLGDRAEGSRIASRLAAMGYRQSLSNRARV